MERDELEDFLEEAISDSLEMDWHPRDGARSILRTLEAAGYQIVQGEPVAVLLSGGDYPDELEFWNHGTGCLTEADKAAGCTEVLLFAKVQP